MSLEKRRDPQYIEGELGEGFSRQLPLKFLYVGIVRDNIDVKRMGRIRVWIPELGDPDIEESWITCTPVLPFAGATPAGNLVKNSTNFTGSQQSYGLIAHPPDIGNVVLVAFVNGRPNFALYLGFLMPEFMNHGIPGLAISSNSDSPDPKPTVEYNKFSNNAILSTLNEQGVSRPVFSPLATALENQGLEKDFVRGPTDASMRRDTPSNVFGLISPRGHHIYIDDGKLAANESVRGVLKEENNSNINRRRDDSSNEYIRIRTRNGVQILINDSDGYIYFITREGNSWAEISDTGINFYSKENINMRSEKNINIHCDGYFNVFSSLDINFASDAQIRLFSQKNMNFLSAENIFAKGVQKVTFKSEDLLAFDSKRLEFQKNKSVEPEAPIIVEVSDLDPETKQFRNTRTVVTQLVYHEPFPHGFRDRVNDFIRPPPGTSAGSSGAPDRAFSTADFDVNDLSDFSIGSCAQRFESGGRPDAVNRNDVGYPSYGIAQIRAAPGSPGMQHYFSLLQQRYPDLYEVLQRAGGIQAAQRGTPEFIAAWESLAKEPTRQRFIESQKIIILSRWYKPTLEQIKARTGADFSTRTMGIKEMVYSLGVQHGPSNGALVVANALRGLNIDSLSDEEILRRVYDERGRTVPPNNQLKYFPSFSRQVGVDNAREQMQRRYAQELQCNLARMRADLQRRGEQIS